MNGCGDNSTGGGERHTDPDRSHEAVARIRRLYDIEVEIKPLDDARRLAARRERSRPLLNTMFGWLDGERRMVFPNSPVGDARGSPW